MEMEKDDFLPRSFIVLRGLWREVKKKAKGVAAPPTENSAHAHLSKKEVNANDKKES